MTEIEGHTPGQYHSKESMVNDTVQGGTLLSVGSQDLLPCPRASSW